MLKGREEESLMTLSRLRDRPPEDPAVQYEFRSLQAERLVEREAAKERYGIDTVNLRVSLLEYKRLLTTKSLLHRLLIGASAQALQQWTGINAIIYYAPSIFQQLGLRGNTTSLLATGLVGIVNFVFTFPAVAFVDSLGRKPMLIWGEINMALSHAIIAAIIAVYGPGFTNKQAGNGAIFMIFWYIVNFAVTWGPLAWVVSAEGEFRSRCGAVVPLTSSLPPRHACQGHVHLVRNQLDHEFHRSHGDPSVSTPQCEYMGGKIKYGSMSEKPLQRNTLHGWRAGSG